ncbi:hypothetical protein EVAR_35434_1 [Eumeta japonica]|uniref:Uncharacterized protein n=1 Tax=Eumeta variegata TaxID=151549 RepID=A0A4C1XB01_EUMVA|nr:hypothetical protein EVAR_35434_1 [Eumeta japonica]
MSIIQMAAFSVSCYLVILDEEQTERTEKLKYIIPLYDSAKAEPLRNAVHRPNLVTTIIKELLCTYRNSMDVACALTRYTVAYTHPRLVRSLQLERYSDANILKDLTNILYLTNRRVEKEFLIVQGFGKRERTRVATIYKTQSLTLKEPLECGLRLKIIYMTVYHTP